MGVPTKINDSVRSVITISQKCLFTLVELAMKNVSSVLYSGYESRDEGCKFF